MSKKYSLDEYVNIINNYLIRHFRFKAFLQSEFFIFLLELSDQLKRMYKGMILYPRLKHDLIAIAFLAFILSA